MVKDPHGAELPLPEPEGPALFRIPVEHWGFHEGSHICHAKASAFYRPFEVAHRAWKIKQLGDISFEVDIRDARMANETIYIVSLAIRDNAVNDDLASDEVINGKEVLGAFDDLILDFDLEEFEKGEDKSSDD